MLVRWPLLLRFPALAITTAAFLDNLKKSHWSMQEWRAVPSHKQNEFSMTGDLPPRSMR